MSIVHGALDVAGFIPVVGAVADVLNAGIYLAEGNHEEVAWAMAAAVPGAGDLAKGARMAKKGAELLAEHGDEAVDAARAIRSVDPNTVRFSQDSIKPTFKDGRTIDDLAAGLRSGEVKPGDVPPVRVVNRDGELFTLDNRRLEAFRRADVPIPYRDATPAEAAREAYKFTTKNDGQSIRIRGER